MVFRFAIFQLLGCFFCCLVFKVHSFFRCPLWFSTSPDCLSILPSLFRFVNIFFYLFYRLFLLSFLLSVLMLPLLPRWCVQFIISSSLCQFFSSLFLLSVQFSLYISNKWNYNQRNTVMLSFCSRVLHHKNFEFPILT